MKTVIGIDPGLSGAIAVVTDDSYFVFDPITLEVKSGKKIRHRYNVAAMVAVFKGFILNYGCCEAWLEDVHAMPGQGVSSMFSMGRGLGTYEGIITALGIPLNFVTPQAWKKCMLAGQGKEKDASVYKAQQLFPNAELVTKRGRALDGRAEALLIAEFGRRIVR